MMKAIDYIRPHTRRDGFGSKREHTLVMWAFATVIMLSTITVYVVGAYNRDSTARPDTNQHQAALVSIQPPPAPRSAKAAQSDEDLKAIALTLYRQGFEMREITRPGGRFLLEIINRSGLASLSLSLSRQNGVVARQVQLLAEQPQWGDIIDLSPGEYVLSVDGRPEWNCKIIIRGR
jgi:hypothetical protein